MTTEGEKVQLYCYDLSGGMAAAFSQMLLGRQIEAIWHTSVVVGAMEHFYGGGINVARAGSTPFGRPVSVLDLGYTEIPEDMRAELLADMSERYTPEAYSLFHNNCNNFSDEFAQMLCGQGVPPHITGLPSEVLSTPFGQMIAPMLSGLEGQMRGMRQQAFTPQTAPAALPAAAAAAATGAMDWDRPSTSAAAAAAAAEPAKQAAAAAAAEGPALLAAEVEIEAAVAAGMMREAEETLHPAPAAAAAAAAPAAAGEPVQAAGVPGGADKAAKLAAELAVQGEFSRIMATGQVAEHEAQALALEAVAAAQSQKEQQQEQQ